MPENKYCTTIEGTSLEFHSEDVSDGSVVTLNNTAKILNGGKNLA